MSTPKNKGVRADGRRNRARILAAAEGVFADNGPSASTEQIAVRAGVAIGTIFRHFPTKQALLQAIMKDLLRQLTDQADALAANGDPATALFTFFTQTVEQAVRKKSVIDLLARTGIDLQITEAVQLLDHSVHTLLTRAQDVGAITPTTRTDEVTTLLAAMCQATTLPSWNPDLQHRTLAVIFHGLTPNPPNPPNQANDKQAEH
ncbi:TetR/AcrR family transcriptional regulator [Actinomadura meridiana]|uniref:TetR/AcrR family transcriptional regulator n=1 Tax=Actinomadura meridiana TaxID=559626 RepID=A0ABP8CAC8_9ACTN